MPDTLNFYLGSKLIEKDKYLYALLDSRFENITEYIFEEVENFYNGFLAVKKNGLWGFLNSNFEQVVDFKFIDVENFEENGLAIVKISHDIGSWVLLNFEGEVLIDKTLQHGFCYISKFEDRNVTIARYEGKFVLINKNGEIVSDYFDHIDYSKSAGVFIGTKDKISLLDSNGKIIYDNCEFCNLNNKGQILIDKNLD